MFPLAEPREISSLTSWDVSRAIKAYSRASDLSSSLYYQAKLAKAKSWVCSWEGYEAENDRIVRQVEKVRVKRVTRQ